MKKAIAIGGPSWRAGWTRLGLCLSLLVFSACGEAPHPAAPRSLRVWLDATEGEMEFYKGALAEAARSVPGLDVELRFLRLEDLKPSLLGASPGASRPDLCLIVNDWIGELVEGGILRPVVLSPGRFFPVAERAVGYGERSWALPSSLSVLALLRNRALVAEAPRQWEELQAWKTPMEKRGVELLAYDNKDFYCHGPFFFAFGGRLFDARGKIDLGGPAAVDSMKWALALQERGLVPARVNKAAMLDLFSSGKAAFAITGAWDLPEFRRNGIDLAVSPLPILPGGRRPRPFVGAKGFAVTRWCRDPEGLRPFLDVLQSRELQLRAMKEISAVPTRRDLAEAASRHAFVGPFLASAQGGEPVPGPMAMGRIWRQMNWALGRVFDFGEDPVRVMTRVREQLAEKGRFR